MCLLPLPNTNYNSIVYKKGITEFDCGACPECLRKRSSIWALRATYESRDHSHNCMITLTYDNFVRDSNRRVIGETPVNPDLRVNMRHIQLFIKRLRKWYSSFCGDKIKYICCAEYGNRTHRAHYHCILFGVKFPDLHYYKKSKRGNVIYTSSILTKLWGYGICTVDSVRVHSAVARYCTKYCAKSRSDDTFMTCSQKIGFNGLWRDFNGKSYMVEGREYTVPRFIWEHYIVTKYQKKYLYLKNAPLLSPKYVNRNSKLSEFDYDFDYERAKKQRAFYRSIRDKDSLYVSYLSYWRSRGETFEIKKIPARTRILQLPDRKYHFYKIEALQVYDRRRKYHLPYIAPNSGCIRAYMGYYESLYGHLPNPSCPNRASDTSKPYLIKKGILQGHFLLPILENPPDFSRISEQISFDL